MLHPSLHLASLWRGRLARAATALGVCLTAAASLGWTAAHTRLESSVPAAGAVLSELERVELRFSGPVNAGLSTCVLVTPSGDSVAVSLAAAPGDDRLLVGDAPALAAGEHLVLWSTVSADGHPVSGEFPFTFAGTPEAGKGYPAEPTEAPEIEDTPVQPAADADAARPAPATGAVVLAGLGLTCLFGFAGLLWFCGTLPLLREARIGRAVRGLGWAALLLLAADLASWAVGVLPAGAGAAGLGAALGSRTGLAGLGRLALVGCALLAVGRHGRAAAALAISAVVVGAAAGHAATFSSWLTIPANAIHLGAVAIWFGGLLLLLLAPSEPSGGSPDGHFGEVLRAVSGAALLAVVLIAASGIVQSVQFVGDYSAYAATAYGRGVLAKTGGLIVLIVFGAFHRFRAIPAFEREGEAQVLRRTVRLETIVMLAVVMLASWLARVSPPAGH